MTEKLLCSLIVIESIDTLIMCQLKLLNSIVTDIKCLFGELEFNPWTLLKAIDVHLLPACQSVDLFT